MKPVIVRFQRTLKIDGAVYRNINANFKSPIT